jgi:3-keto-disaccharide hydrolase
MCSPFSFTTTVLRFILVAALVLGTFVHSTSAADKAADDPTAAKKAEGWKPLFDGKTLKGWHPVGDGKWTVEDGAIVGRANNEKLYGLLFTDKEFTDFDVRFKFKVLSGDSGFYIHTVFKKPDQAHGNQVQVGLSGSGVGGVYESYGRGWTDKPSDELQKKILKDRDWNEMTISAKAGNIVVHVNGTKTADLKNDPSRRKGHCALQMHSGNVMHLMFKDIEMRCDP